MSKESKYCGFVSLLGEPNVGKSTLVNCLVGAKVSIVTHKAQTTRAHVRGITLVNCSQIVFIDSPGVFVPKRRLDKSMISAAWNGVIDSDIILVMVEANRGVTEGLSSILITLRNFNMEKKVILAINKIDRIKRDNLLELSMKLNQMYGFFATFMISATKGHGVNDLKKWLSENLPSGPWLYPEDQIADYPMKLFAAELTREKLLLKLHEELPYHLTVEPESWDEKTDGSVRIDQLVYVAHERHKGIVIGARGETIKAVSVAARRELTAILGRNVHLFLRIKVRENWQNEPIRFSNIGLDFSPRDIKI